MIDERILNYYRALKLMYVDKIEEFDDAYMVRSDVIDDGIWNFLFVKDNEKSDEIFEAKKHLFVDRTPRFYILNPNDELLGKLEEKYNMYCDDSWFISDLSTINLTQKSKIVVQISDSPSKEDVIETIMKGFSTGDPNDPYGDLSPTYRQALEMKWGGDSEQFECKHFVAYYDDKPVSIATITYNDEIAYLNNVTTLKEYKGNGISKEVLKEIVEFLKKNKIKIICFATENGAYTEDFYKKMGFVVKMQGYCFEEK